MRFFTGLHSFEFSGHLEIGCNGFSQRGSRLVFVHASEKMKAVSFLQEQQKAEPEKAFTEPEICHYMKNRGILDKTSIDQKFDVKDFLTSQKAEDLSQSENDLLKKYQELETLKKTGALSADQQQRMRKLETEVKEAESAIKCIALEAVSLISLSDESLREQKQGMTRTIEKKVAKTWRDVTKQWSKMSTGGMVITAVGFIYLASSLMSAEDKGFAGAVKTLFRGGAGLLLGSAFVNYAAQLFTGKSLLDRVDSWADDKLEEQDPIKHYFNARTLDDANLIRKAIVFNKQASFESLAEGYKKVKDSIKRNADGSLPKDRKAYEGLPNVAGMQPWEVFRSLEIAFDRLYSGDEALLQEAHKDKYKDLTFQQLVSIKLAHDTAFVQSDKALLGTVLNSAKSVGAWTAEQASDFTNWLKRKTNGKVDITPDGMKIAWNNNTFYIRTLADGSFELLKGTVYVAGMTFVIPAAVINETASWVSNSAAKKARQRERMNDFVDFMNNETLPVNLTNFGDFFTNPAYQFSVGRFLEGFRNSWSNPVTNGTFSIYNEAAYIIVSTTLPPQKGEIDLNPPDATAMAILKDMTGLDKQAAFLEPVQIVTNTADGKVYVFYRAPLHPGDDYSKRYNEIVTDGQWRTKYSPEQVKYMGYFDKRIKTLRKYLEETVFEKNRNTFPDDAHALEQFDSQFRDDISAAKQYIFTELSKPPDSTLEHRVKQREDQCFGIILQSYASKARDNDINLQEYLKFESSWWTRLWS